MACVNNTETQITHLTICLEACLTHPFNPGYSLKNTYTPMAYNKLEFNKFRVRTPIKSFRDLDVYKNTTSLCVDIFNLKLPEKYRKNDKLREELKILYNLSKHIPRLIAESHSQKFSNLNQATGKLEKTAQITNLAISKIDFLSLAVDESQFRESLLELVKKYQTNKTKILNLKKSWIRWQEKCGNQ